MNQKHWSISGRIYDMASDVLNLFGEIIDFKRIKPKRICCGTMEKSLYIKVRKSSDHENEQKR